MARPATPHRETVAKGEKMCVVATESMSSLIALRVVCVSKGERM